MQKRGLTASSFLRSSQLRSKYQCGICYQVCIKPVRCRGQCSKIFCMRCVSDIRQEVDRCPYKCSSPFLVERIADIQLDFFCPYNPTACHSSIKTLKDFDNHYQLCPFVSPQEHQQKELQRQYQCIHGHQLQFFIGSYEEMLESACVTCDQVKLCRSLCRICEKYYCVDCRVPPCTKSGCPLSHAFSFQRISNLNFICDICGVSTAVSNNGVYDDSLCNFGICEGCFSELPQKFDESKPRELIANINTLCSCGTRLQLVNSLYHPTQCQLCRKTKQCPKRCFNCHKGFCISCKLIDINRDGTCVLQHEFQLQKKAFLQGYGQKEQPFGCMRCGRPQNQYFYDRICNLRLCEACLVYCQTITIDKQRPIILKCNKNHVLTYVTGRQDWYDTCQRCKKQKIIRLRCNYCDESGVSFCFQCKHIPLETCYYKHKLKLSYFQSNRQCQLCRRITSEFHHCRKCYFYACKQCVQTSLGNESMETEPELQKIEKTEIILNEQQSENACSCKHEAQEQQTQAQMIQE